MLRLCLKHKSSLLLIKQLNNCNISLVFLGLCSKTTKEYVLPMKQAKSLFRYFLIAIVLLSFLLWGWLDHFSSPVFLDFTESQDFINFARQSGFAGPLIIIAAMATAIVLSPFPSAPIALASGAIYGHFEGTIYIFIGSLLGASTAFAIARMLGFQAAKVWLEKALPNWKLGDQRRLMWMIMLSRLMPFVSFDLISYAAGITALSYARFLFATAIGILPASFLLAHFGAKSMEQSMTVNLVIVAALLIGTGLWHVVSVKRKNTNQ